MGEKEVLDIPEIVFDDEQKAEQNAGQASVGQAAPEPPAPPAPGPAAVGPYTAQVKGQYEAAQRAYKELLERKKKLVEAGYTVPVEVDAEISQYAAKLAYLESSLEDAKRRDALAAVPLVVSRLVAELSPEVAKRVEPELKRTLEQAVMTNPEVIYNQSALQIALQATLGNLVMSRYRAGGKPSAPQAGVQAASPPPMEQKKVPEMPDLAKKLGVSESAWAKVANADNETLDIDLF